jgi:hypothetical protein
MRMLKTIFLGFDKIPLLVLSRADEVLNGQALSHTEPPLCRAMRDTVLLLVQLLGRTNGQIVVQFPTSELRKMYRSLWRSMAVIEKPNCKFERNRQQTEAE